MGDQKIRQPKQKRSIEKRKKIIEAGYQLFYEKGYYNTNTAEIAKRAGVSTGIIYSYFRDKKDIFMEIIEAYFTAITDPMYDLIKSIQQPVETRDIARHLINSLIKSHTMGKSVHDEIMSLAKTDDDIGQLYYQFEEDVKQKIIGLLCELNIRPSHLNERIHIIVNLVESMIHESVYQRQETLNYDIIVDDLVNIIVYLLSN